MMDEQQYRALLGALMDTLDAMEAQQAGNTGEWARRLNAARFTVAQLTLAAPRAPRQGQEREG